jgi:Flp pilus assembly protein TadD
MTAADAVKRGLECAAAGDAVGAEAAYREADQLDDAQGAILLGLTLKRRGEANGAMGAFQRAEARGHPEAGSSLGNLLDECGDVDGARAAYERSIAAGSADALLNLGLMLAQRGEQDEALTYLRRAQDNGDEVASWAIGKLLEEREDWAGAADAYRRGANGGNAYAAFGLGVVLWKMGDREGSRSAFHRAQDLGHEGAKQALEGFENEDIQATAKAAAEAGAKWARLYAAACEEVLATVNACLEVANLAVGARNMANRRPQHEGSIRMVTKHAEKFEREFTPLYEQFEEACASARESAAQLLATYPGHPEYAELLLSGTVDDSVLNTVATVKALLEATWGPTPAAFVEAVGEANEIMQQEDEENIYRPAAAASSDERICPWCAETIKTAAVICRYCGRDVQV